MSSILSTEETIRTSQVECVHTVSCRVFHGGSSEKKIKILTFACAEIFAKLSNIFSKNFYFKNLFRVFLRT